MNQKPSASFDGKSLESLHELGFKVSGDNKNLILSRRFLKTPSLVIVVIAIFLPVAVLLVKDSIELLKVVLDFSSFWQVLSKSFLPFVWFTILLILAWRFFQKFDLKISTSELAYDRKWGPLASHQKWLFEDLQGVGFAPLGPGKLKALVLKKKDGQIERLVLTGEGAGEALILEILHSRGIPTLSSMF